MATDKLNNRTMLSGICAAMLLLSCCAAAFGAESNALSACLYYAKGRDISKLCFPNRSTSFVHSIPASVAPKQMSTIQVGINSLAWLANEERSRWQIPYIRAAHICTWTAAHGLIKRPVKSLRIVEGIGGPNEKGEIDLGYMSAPVISGFLLSPDGTLLLWNTNRLVKVKVDESKGGVAYVEHVIHSAKTDKGTSRVIFREQVVSQGFQVDHLESRDLVRWSRLDPNRVYMTTYNSEQLHSGEKGLLALDLTTRKFKRIHGDEQKVLDFSPDEQFIARTPVDKSCCSVDNQTNNTVSIYDIATRKSRMVFNEWKEFGNDPEKCAPEKREEEHPPSSAFFSPDGKFIAISIVSELVTIRSVADGREVAKLSGRRAIGWTDTSRLLVVNTVSMSELVSKEDTKSSIIAIYDTGTRMEEVLPLREVVIIGLGPP